MQDVGCDKNQSGPESTKYGNTPFLMKSIMITKIAHAS